MIRRQTVCVTEIVELLGVTPPASSKLVNEPGFPSRSDAKDRAGCGIGARS